MHARHVKGWIGIIFTDKYSDTQLVLIIVRHLDCLHHGTDHVDAVVGKIDDTLRTGPHTGSAATAAGRISQWCTFLIIIKRAKGTLLCTAFALGAALEEEIRIGHIARARVHRYPTISRFNALNRFQGRTSGIVNGFLHGFGLAYATTGVHTGAPGLIGKADKVGVSIAVKQIQITEARSLSVGQVGHCSVKRGRHHTSSQNHHIHFKTQIFTQKGVLHHNGCAGGILLHLGHRTFGHEDTVFGLHGLVEKFSITGGAHVLVQYVGLSVLGVVFHNIVGLLERNHGGDRVAVGEVLICILATRALHKSHPSRYFAVLGQLLELGIGDHSLDRTISQMFEFVHAGRRPTSGDDYGTKQFTIRIEQSVLLHALVRIFQFAAGDLLLFFNRYPSWSIPLCLFTGLFEGYIKLAWSTGNTGNFSVSLHRDFCILRHLGNQLVNGWLFQRGIGIGRGKHFSPAQGFTAQNRVFFHQGHFVTGSRSLFGCSQTGEATTHNQNLPGDALQHIGLGQGCFLGPGDSHAYIVCAHFL